MNSLLLRAGLPHIDSQGMAETAELGRVFTFRILQQRRTFYSDKLQLGNRNGEELPYVESLRSHKGAAHVIFGGYRTNIEELHRGCFAGIIASTGWDSPTCSSMEMQASGLPLLLSNLPGLNEAIEPNSTGLLFAPGDSCQMAAAMTTLLDDAELHQKLSAGARQRITEQFTHAHQVTQLVAAVRVAIGTR